MIPEVGHYALILGFAFALLGGTVPVLGLIKKDSYLTPLCMAVKLWRLSFYRNSYRVTGLQLCH